MATKKKPKNVTKSAFVRGLPSALPAKEVVANAKKEGIQLSVAQVYNIRSTAKLKKKATGAPGAARGGRSGRPSSDGAEARLRSLIAELGLARTRAVFADVQAAFAG
jgi:hypothetical protein